MAEPHLLSPKGFKANGVYAGIKSKQTPDVGLLVCETMAAAAAVFTTNRVVAAPVIVGREHIAAGRLRGIIVNAGNANACTGRKGLADAREMCRSAAEVLKCEFNQILPSSTGIIGHLLPMDKVQQGIAAVGQDLGDSAEHALRFGDAILTTDTKRKAAHAQFKVGRETVTLAGVCKGSGMIGPRMALSTSKGKPARHATMLAYLTTDAAIAPARLRQILSAASDASFNAVTVDDHASTNDTACLLASGLSGASIDSPAAIKSFTKALNEVCQSLAYQIAADGEGATKVVRIEVTGAKSESDARAMARAIANSPLVKCAMHGNDPNWGRIVSAAGFAGVPFNPDKATLTLQGTVVFKSGQPVSFDAEAVSKMLSAAEVRAVLNCRMGKSSATCWTCDLSREYITINADYQT
jgi:glutamate N-acetyltransferase/amino-acid N-acetyltransferase